MRYTQTSCTTIEDDWSITYDAVPTSLLPTHAYIGRPIQPMTDKGVFCKNNKKAQANQKIFAEELRRSSFASIVPNNLITRMAKALIYFAEEISIILNDKKFYDDGYHVMFSTAGQFWLCENRDIGNIYPESCKSLECVLYGNLYIPIYDAERDFNMSEHEKQVFEALIRKIGSYPFSSINRLIFASIIGFWNSTNVFTNERVDIVIDGQVFLCFFSKGSGIAVEDITLARPHSYEDKGRWERNSLYTFYKTITNLCPNNQLGTSDDTQYNDYDE